LGGAYTALADDAQSLYENPAGLGALKSPNFGSTYSSQSQDQRLWSLEFASPLGSFGGLGAGLLMNQIGGIEGRTDEYAAPTAIDSKEGAVLLSYGYAPSEGWSVGATAKYLFHRFGGLSDTGSGRAFDLGGRFTPPQIPALTLGAAAQNLAGSFHWSTGRADPVLFAFKTGAAYRLAPWMLAAADVDVRGDSAVRLHAGLEATYFIVAFRVGADHDRPTFGFGLTSPAARVRVKFDYAFEYDSHGLADVNRFSFSAKF
jgi:hypothetical protein